MLLSAPCRAAGDQNINWDCTAAKRERNPPAASGVIEKNGLNCPDPPVQKELVSNEIASGFSLSVIQPRPDADSASAEPVGDVVTVA
jgi:hypothetical protein